MRRLAVMAHFEPRGRLAPHTRRQVEALVAAVDDVVVVTTAELTDATRTWLAARTRLVERSNSGYDFFSYKVGLDASDLAAYDEVVVCNDSYVGPLVPYEQVLATMAERPVDFWGLTTNRRLVPHVQSFFVAFRSWTVASAAFTRFWAELEPLSDRMKVINRYEIGMSKTLHDAGLVSSSYFEEDADDERLGRRRVWWWWAHREPLPRTRVQLAAYQRQVAAGWNPAAGMADRALQDGRLPYVKLDTLRYDPYVLGAERLLSLCEARFPDAFDGVRAYLEETAVLYPRRAAETPRPTAPALRPLRPLVEYRGA